MSRSERDFDEEQFDEEQDAESAVELCAPASDGEDDSAPDDRVDDEPPPGDDPRDQERHGNGVGSDVRREDLTHEELPLDDLALQEEPAELDLDDVVIDESAFPPLDAEDGDVLADERGHDDLIDRSWLEREVEVEGDDEPPTTDAFGLTIELDGPSAEDEGEVVELDVGALLTSLADTTELDLEPTALERAEALGALRDVLLPEDQGDDDDDREIGDDDRFPVFDDAALMRRRPAEDEAEDGPEDEPS